MTFWRNTTQKLYSLIQRDRWIIKKHCQAKPSVIRMTVPFVGNDDLSSLRNTNCPHLDILVLSPLHYKVFFPKKSQGNMRTRTFVSTAVWEPPQARASNCSLQAVGIGNHTSHPPLFLPGPRVMLSIEKIHVAGQDAMRGEICIAFGLLGKNCKYCVWKRYFDKPLGASGGILK